MSAPFTGLPRLDLRSPSGSAGDHRAEDQSAEHEGKWRALCARSFGLEGEADEAARQIIASVREEGDVAVARFTERFESRQLEPQDFEVHRSVAERALAELDTELRTSLERAADNVRRFHESQVPRTTGLDLPDGRLESRAAPLRRVAVYAPGGTAAYPSSVLMAAIPAKVAGVPEVVLLTPRASPVVLAAALLAGVDRIFAIGGAQSIAAAAFGTRSVPRVDKIVGPGNAYVTAAKRQVYGRCDIDSIAGPSEILVVADAGARADLVAADLISQAEHDRLASPVLLTDAPELADAVDRALVEQLATLPRAEIAKAALRDHGAAVLVADRQGLLREAEAFAPEHLELLVEDPRAMAAEISGAGAIFVGSWTPEAAGDYTAGPSHVLPTAGAARFASPLGVWDFIKYTSVIELGEASLRDQAADITRLARAEGLEGHARAVEMRLTTGDGAEENGS
jgi:histidinol dehydrogenase